MENYTRHERALREKVEDFKLKISEAKDFKSIKVGKKFREQLKRFFKKL